MEEPEPTSGTAESLPASKPEWARGAGPAVAGPTEPAAPSPWSRPGPGPAMPAGTPPAPPGPSPTPGPPGGRRKAAAAAVLIAAALLAGFVGGVFGRGDRTATAPAPTPTASQPAAAQAAPPVPSNLGDIYRQLLPSVVQVLVRDPAGRGEGGGTGLIIDPQGTVLTNNHVIGGAQAAQVVLHDGTTLQTTLAGTDPQRDLAVLRITDPPQTIVPARLGNSDQVGVGDPVVAIGHPFGLPNSLTFGIVSAVDRFFRGNAEYPPMPGLIQTDAAINPGNSGGPLVNMAGEVVGVTTAIESPVRGSVGVGFAVPINTAVRNLPALMQGVSISHAFLGIQGEGSPEGVRVIDVLPGTAAEAAGIRAGDLIRSIGGAPVTTMEVLARVLDRYGAGDAVDVAVRREGRDQTLRATLKTYERR